MDSSEVSRWFGEYLDAFASCGRGESDTVSLLVYYGVPLLLTTDDGLFALTGADQVVAVVQRQVDGMGAAVYACSEILSSEVTVLNSTSALYRGTFSRRRRDGDCSGHQKGNPSGTISTIAGDNVVGYSGDGGSGLSA